jgi:hypothetical protein
VNGADAAEPAGAYLLGLAAAALSGALVGATAYALAAC